MLLLRFFLRYFLFVFAFFSRLFNKKIYAVVRMEIIFIIMIIFIYSIILSLKQSDYRIKIIHDKTK